MMKKPSVWSIAKWGAVLLVYGVTVAIGIDQIRERDRTIEMMRKKIILDMDYMSRMPPLDPLMIERANRELDKIVKEVEASDTAVEENRLRNEAKVRAAMEELARGRAERAARDHK